MADTLQDRIRLLGENMLNNPDFGFSEELIVNKFLDLVDAQTPEVSAKDRAIEVIAQHIARLSLNFHDNFPEWEDYPDIDESVWDAIMKRVETMITGVDKIDYNAAYDLLSSLGKDRKVK